MMLNQPTRRNFLKTSGAVMAGAAIAPSISSVAYAQSSSEVKIALVGCGGRGTGAVNQALDVTDGAKLVAVADVFEGKTRSSLNNIRQRYPEQVTVDDDHIFVGMDAYKQAIDSDADLVILATPPGFRPLHFEYAVQKGKHVFAEKPVAVDAPGIRRMLAANEIAKQKNLTFAVGFQRRHENQYTETVKRLLDGAIGRIDLLRVYWNGGGIWYRERQPDQSEMQFQLNNWFHFIWTCGDQICEQHVHNIDVGCWVKDAYPVEANGMGAWELRENGNRGRSQIYHQTFCEFTFPDGSKMYSQGRHVGNVWNQVSEFAHGEKGTSNPGSWVHPYGGERVRSQGGGGHRAQMTPLVTSIQKNEPYNEGDYAIRSTFAAILGREACYSGQVVKWDELLENGRSLAPEIDQYTLQSVPPVIKGDDGNYPWPIPGQYNPLG